MIIPQEGCIQRFDFLLVDEFIETIFERLISFNKGVFSIDRAIVSKV